MVNIKIRDKAKRISNERNLAALANDTKWTELFTEVTEKQIYLEVKFIDSEIISKPTRVWIPAQNYLEGMGFGPDVFCLIEWVRAKSDSGLSSIADLVGLVHVNGGCVTTVYGYR